MQIFDPDARFCQIIREILCHFFRQGRDEHLVMTIRFLMYLADQIVNLSLNRTHIDFRIQKSGRANDLLSAEHLMIFLILSGRSGHEQHLINLIFKFLKIQRTVVQCRRKAKAVINQSLFAAAIAVVHRTDLRNRHVRLIDDNEKIIRKEIHERKWL